MRTGIITHPKVPHLLIKKMEIAFKQAIIDWKLVTFKDPIFSFKNGTRHDYITMESEPFTPPDPFDKAMLKAWYIFFNPIKYPATQEPYMWATLNIRYISHGMGENGLDLMLDSSPHIYYGVVEEKWFTRKEVAEILKKPDANKLSLSQYYKNLYS